nr:autotransporter outer membrane beta-barrel domain-containing protein [Pseudomonas sp. Marseille-Q5115]
MHQSNSVLALSIERALKRNIYHAVATLVFFPLSAHAVVISTDTEITGDTGQYYDVRNGATLTAKNASILTVSAMPGGRLLFDGVVITKTAVPDSSNHKAAFTGSGVLSNSQVTNLDTRPGNSYAVHLGPGGELQIINSVISGVGGGVQVSQGSLEMSNSTVTGETSAGMELWSANATVSQSTITGESGVMLGEFIPGMGSSALTLIGSQVVGTSKAAIEVGFEAYYPVEADILLQDGTTLTGNGGVAVHVNDGSNGHVTADNSAIVGDYVVDNGGTGDLLLRNGASWTGRLENLNSLAVDSNAQWNMVESASLAALSMNGGTVKLGEGSDFFTLQVGELSGAGNFALHTDFSTDTSDLLQITGSSAGDHTLQIAASGQDAATGNDIQVVETADGVARFSLLNGRVDVGAYQYDLVQNGNDWYLTPTDEITPGTASVLALFNATPTVWYGEMSTLRSRMGELRLTEGKSGGWLRSYGNKFNVATGNGVGYSQYQHGLSLGADAAAPWGDGQWLVGVMAGYSESNLDLTRGTTGEVNSYYAGLYTTWFDKASGYYFDGTIKANRFRNKADVTLSDESRAKGNYDTVGAGVSAEFGRHIELDDGYFLEPYTQWTALAVQGRDYDLNNGMQADGDRARSLLGKAGVTAGRTFDLSSGQKVQPYVRATVAREFARNNAVSVNGNRFDNDLAGSRGELGAGIAVSVADRLQLHADFDYSHGEAIEQPWGVNVGLRYHW